MKKLLTLFINPWFFMIAGGACFGIMALDYLMHKNCDVFEIWYCTSFVGRFFMILGGIILGGNIAGRILIVLWMGLKWVGSKLMGAVAL